MDDLFLNATIVPNIAASGKRRALQALAEALSIDNGLDPHTVMELLLAREQLGATGVGGGVAMPHGRVADLKQLLIAFGRLNEPVEYESPDGQAVDLILMILAPEDSGSICLKALSIASRVLRSNEVRDQLRQAEDIDTIREILCRKQEAIAA
ncbi:MAG: PTS sugar transporter subunit IIA [Rhodospirillales bacterium]